MRWIARVFVSPIVRSVSAFPLAAALCLLGVGPAHAATYEDQGSAYSACKASNESQLAQIKAGTDPVSAQKFTGQCIVGTGQAQQYGRYRSQVLFNGGHYAMYGDFDYPKEKTCDARPSQTTRFLPVTGSTGCNRGCVVKYAQNADETSRVSSTGGVCTDADLKKDCPSGSYWNGYMGVCEPVDKPCPEGQKKEGGQCVPDGKCPDGMVGVQGSTPGAVQQGSLYCKPSENECPAGNVKSPSGKCLPGDGQCAAGEAKRENGTCGKDKDGDGKADEDDDDPDNDPKKDSASGGDECDAPPSCSGNAIQCIQVKIQWRIDCNTRRQVNINGGTCEAVPICTGKGCNAMEYAQLMQQWRATCALEKLAKKEGDDQGDGPDANGNGVPDALEGTGDVADAGDGAADVAGTKKFGIGVSTSLLNQENIFGGGSCPQPPTFKLMGQTISGSDFPYWCQAMAILRALILLWGAYTALKILMGWGF